MMSLTRQMEKFPNLLDLFHTSVLNKGRPFVKPKKKK